MDQYTTSRRLYLAISGFIGVFLLTAGMAGLLFAFSNDGLLMTFLGLTLCIGTVYIAVNTPRRRR